jgi:PGF-pre-PGF domain-containing protein
VDVELPPATIKAENQTAMSNTTVRVPIRALNATAVTEFTANVSYDPTVANVTGVTASGADDATVTIDNDTGTLRFQHQYSERDTPVVNVTFDVHATNDTSTQLGIEQATVDTAGSRDPSVATRAGRLTIFESAVQVTNTTLSVTTSRPDETVVVNATVTNPAPIAGEFAVPLHVNQSQESVRNVTLAANETTPLQFTYTPTETGARPVSVGSGTVQTLAVEEVVINETNTTTVIETRTAPGTPLNSSLAGTNGTTDDGVSLNQLNISTTRETNVSIEVNVSGDSSRAPPLGDAAAYLNISESMPEDAIGTVTFEFTVDTEQLSDPESAELYRYHDGTWNALETTYLGERNGEFRFRAISPGLSIFAIGQPTTTVDTGSDDGSNDAIESDDDSESTPASTPAPTTPSTPEPSTATPGSTDGETASPQPPSGEGDTQTSEPPAAVETSQPATTPTEPGGFSPPLFVIVLVLLGGIIAVTALLRRQDRL